MMSSNLIEFTKIELDYRFDKNQNFINLKNKTENEFILENEGTKYILLGSDTISFEFKNKNLNLKIFENKDNLIQEINIDFSEYKINGIGGDSFIESPNGKIMIKNLKSMDIIYDSNLNDLLVKCLILFKIDGNDNIYPILIKKSNCGINLPYSDTTISINQILRIKNTFIRGRQLFLNRKGSKVNTDNNILYNIISDPSNTYFSNGFILSSYNFSNSIN